MKNKSGLATENITVKTKKPLRTLYKGVKLPVFRTLFGSLLYLAGTLIVATQADAVATIAVGKFKDLSPIFMYALMCFIGYIFSFAAVVADLGFVELSTRIRKKIWKKIMHLPLSYADRESPNRVLSRVTADPEYSCLPFKLLQLVFTLVAFLLMVLVGDAAIAELVPLLIIGFIVNIVIMLITARFSERGALYVAGKLSAFTAFLAERFGRIRFIKAMNSEEKENAASLRCIEERYKADKYNAMANTCVQFGQFFLTFVLFVAAFLVGSLLISKGSVTSGTELAAFYAYGGNLVLVFQFFSQFPSVFSATKGGSKKIVSILEEKEEDVDRGSAELSAEGDLCMDRVSFGYAGREVIHGISTRIPKGKITAIVGPNGSGKTTILKLLDRLYPDFDGNIRMGEAGSEVSLRAWRDRFGVVSQNAGLFEGSIRDNICYGVRDVKEEELAAVIKLACLEDLVASHEGGLDFNVGFNGGKLSGGEQQRIAIARAMLKNPDYLILDEATANLDPVTEEKIRAGIDVLTQGRTAIMVAHNFRTVAKAGHVIVMRNGTVEDEGTVEELKARNEFFRAFAET